MLHLATPSTVTSTLSPPPSPPPPSPAATLSIATLATTALATTALAIDNNSSHEDICPVVFEAFMY